MRTPLSSPWSTNQDPEVLNDLLVELVDSENAPGSYVRTPPGTAHDDQNTYPGYIFLTQKTVGHDKVQRYWTTPTYQNEDVYNWDLDYVNDSAAHPIFVRRYKTRRDKYVEVARESTLTGLWKITVTNPGTQYDPANPPTVTIGGPGTGATAVALVNVDGTISFVRITAEGTGYTSTPMVTIAASSGTQAIATATIQSQSCKLIKQTVQNFPEDDPRYALFVLETRVYQAFPSSTLTKWDFEPRIEKYVKVDKRLILKSQVPADPNAVSLTPGVTVEYQDLTSVYSAEVTTTVPADLVWENDGEDFVYEATVNHRFPDQINTGDDPVVIAAYAISTNQVAAAYGWDCKVREGYSGPCRAVITERYTFDPTDAAFIAALPAPTQVFPVAQTIFVRIYGFEGGDKPFAEVRTFVIPFTLHPALVVTSDAVGNYGTLTPDWKVDVPATVPIGFYTGDSMLVVSEPQRLGLGGLWLCRFIEIFHP